MAQRLVKIGRRPLNDGEEAHRVPGLDAAALHLMAEEDVLQHEEGEGGQAEHPRAPQQGLGRDAQAENEDRVGLGEAPRPEGDARRPGRSAGEHVDAERQGGEQRESDLRVAAGQEHEAEDRRQRERRPREPAAVRGEEHGADVGPGPVGQHLGADDLRVQEKAVRRGQGQQDERQHREAEGRARRRNRQRRPAATRRGRPASSATRRAWWR